MRPLLVILSVSTLLSACGGASDSGADVEADPPTSESDSIGQEIVEVLDDSDDVGCATDKRLVETALEMHLALTGDDASTMQDLAQFGVDADANRWVLDAPADAATTQPIVVPAADGPCAT